MSSAQGPILGNCSARGLWAVRQAGCSLTLTGIGQGRCRAVLLFALNNAVGLFVCFCFLTFLLRIRFEKVFCPYTIKN